MLLDTETQVSQLFCFVDRCWHHHYLLCTENTWLAFRMTTMRCHTYSVLCMSL